MRSTSIVFVAVGTVLSTLTWAQGGPGQGGGQGAGSGMGGPMQACHADVQTLCKDVPPGGGRIINCLKDHRDQVSEACRNSLRQALERRQGGGQDIGPGGQRRPPGGDREGS